MAKKKLIVGAARECITPPAEIFPIEHFWVRGTDKVNKFGGKILQDVFFRILIVNNGEESVVMAAFDLPGVPRVKEYTEIISKVTGIPEDHILLTCTHNHSCIYIDNDHFDHVYGEEYHKKAEFYRDRVGEAVERAAKAAVESMRPAKMGWVKDSCYLNVNRREMLGGSLGTYGFNAGGSADRDLVLLRFDDYDGNCIALMYNFAVHACMMIHNDPEGKGTEVSGDLPGYACRLIEQSMDDKPVVMFTSGAAGDMNPLMMGRVNIVKEHGELEVVQLGAAGPIILEFMGRRFARYITDANEKMVCDVEAARIFCEKDEAQLPAPHEKMPPRHLYMGTMMIGDIAIAFTNGEWVHKIGMRLKEDSPFNKTIIVTHCGPHIGYVLDDSGEGVEEKTLRESVFKMMKDYSEE